MNELPNKQKRSGFTVYAILTTLTLLSWALYGAYIRLVKVDLTSIQESILAPVNPNLDTSTLDLLEKKRYVRQEQITSFVPKQTSTPAPQTESTEASPAGQASGVNPAIQTE